MSTRDIAKRQFSPPHTPGVVKWQDGTLVAPGRVDSLPTCDQDREGTEVWVRGGGGVASARHLCLKAADDTYNWEQVAVADDITIDVQEEGVSVVAAADTLNFESDHFAVTDETGGVAGVAAKRLTTHVCFLTWPNRSGATSNQWLDMPAAVTELFGETRHRAPTDLTNATQARLSANVFVAGASGAQLRLEYSTDDGATWDYVHTADDTPAVLIDGTGLVVSGWIDIDAAAQADVLLRLSGDGGNGTADPQFGNLYAEFR